MTVFDGKDFDDSARYLSFSAREFVRRLRYAITRQENRFVWFLGAGCSVSSGIPTAAEIARRWLKELKYLQTATEGDLDTWAAKHFFGYDPDQPATVYSKVFQELFYTDADRRRALEELMAVAEPGFGYATLAQLMTHKSWGRRANFAVTTNFDDLPADALHLFSQDRPQVFAAEALGIGTPVSASSPTIVKIHGDAHLAASPDQSNRPQVPDAARLRIREKICDAGLIFVGYGGRDASVIDLLEGLPHGEPSGGVFWINDEPPSDELKAWMQNRRTVWVRHSDFDELMYFVRLEFGLGHPKVDRFERSLRRYDSQYRELSTRAGLGISETPAQGAVEAPTPEQPDADAPRARTVGLRAPGTIGARKETKESRRERMRQSLAAFSKAVRPKKSDAGGESGGEGGASGGASGSRPDPVAVKTKLIDAAKHELRGASRSGAEIHDASVVSDAPGARRPLAPSADAGSDETTIDDMLTRLEDGSSLKIAQPGEPKKRPAADRLSPRQLGAGEGGDAQSQLNKRLQVFEDAKTARLETRTTFPMQWVEDPFLGGALPAEPIGPVSADDALKGDRALSDAIASSEDPGPLQARRARFLAIAARDLERAEEAFEAAQQLAPDDVRLLRDYARFAVEQLRDAPRAERLLTRALNLDLRNAETLGALADFLVRARGDLDEAENCHRLALEVAPDHAGNRVAYARFLLNRRGRRDAAEAELIEACEIVPRSAEALAELALLRLSEGGAIEQTARMLDEAGRLAPEDALVAYARGALAERKGEIDAAATHYARAVELGPRLIRAQLAYAAFLQHRSGDVRAAETQLRRAVAAAPDEGEPLSALATLVEVEKGDAREAERLHRDAVEREPYHAAVRAAYAAFLGRRGDRMEEADALFQDALTITAQDAEILRAYGRFLQTAKGDADAAETYLRRAVDVSPASVEAVSDLARFYQDVRRDAEQAEVYFRDAVRLAPDRAETLNRFAAFLRDTRRNAEDAEDAYRRAIEANPKDPTVLSKAAQFLLSEGRTDEGLKVLNDAFDAAYSMDPSSRPRWLMLELWIYRYAHDPARREDSARAALVLIEAGARSEGWDMEPTVERAIAGGHPNPKFLRDLVCVATDGADPTVLDKYARP